MHELYILATPIGNINEANQLLINKLNELKVIFCEDTRVTKQLLNLLNITNKPELISFHKFNEHEKLSIATKYLENCDCGLISDAGYPTISDPGYELVNYCHQQQIKVNIINGTSAIMHAIVQSGFCSHGFIFIGFNNKKLSFFKKELDKYLLNFELPVIFYVSVHQCEEVINFLKINYANNQLYIGRELTKKFEWYYVGFVKDIPEIILKGEFCFILNPLVKETTKNTIDTSIINELLMMTECNIQLKDACKFLAKKYDLDRHLLYEKAITIKKK